MATVGDVIKEPEAGWSRINYKDNNLTYNGNWTSPASYGEYLMGWINSTVTFKFFGTGFRYVSNTFSDTSSNVKIIIDGIETAISTNGKMANGGTKPAYTILFEKIGLSSGVHTVTLKNATSADEVMLSNIFDIKGNIINKNIGSQLLEPEAGWKRIDDTDPRILYAGAMGSQWYQKTQNEVMKTYKNTLTYVMGTTTPAKIKFDFIGSKLRLICATYYDYTTAVIVKIDGVEVGTFSQRDTNITGDGTNGGSRLLFEKTGLEFKRHSVEIIKKDSGLFNLDAIDIDDNGDLITILYTKLVQPEKGWNRFDDYDPRIKYSTTGNWQGSNGATSAYDKYYNKTFHYKHSAQGTEWVDYSFKFYGTKLRIIGSVTRDYGYNNVSINGKLLENIYYNKEEPYYQDAEQRILYEVTDLPLGIHDVKVWGQYSNLDAIDTDGELVYNINDPITTIDNSWVRYDDNDTRIIFNGLFTQNNASGYYNNTIKYVSDLDKDKEGYNTTKTIKFKFYGTKLRIIGALSTPYYDTDTSVKIDGENVGTINFVNPTVVKQALVFQKLGLASKVHEVEISGIILNFDAVDIGSDGYLCHPYLTERTKIEDMQIGDCIACKYMNKSGGLDYGAFKDIGRGNYTTIPIGNNTSNIYGVFYLIKVANGLLIADRNVRTGVIWQNMNVAGYVEGKPLRVGTDFTPTNIGYISIPYSDTMNTGIISTRIIASHNDWNSITDIQDLFNNFENQGYGFEIDGTKKLFLFQAYIKNTGKYFIASIPLSSLSAGSHSFTGSFDGKYVKLYVDGELKATTDVGTLSVINYSYKIPFLIGANPDTTGKPVSNNGFYFKGKIFETAVWSNYALTDDEVKNLPKRLTGIENRLTHLWDGNMDLSYNDGNTFYDIVGWLDAKGYGGVRYNVLDNDLSDNIIVRIPSGGNSYIDGNGNNSFTDKGLGGYPSNNEWDRYVVNFPTKFIKNNGTLEKIWNINGTNHSYTSDITKNNVTILNGTKATDTKFRTSRGLNNIKGFSIGLWNGVESNIGFRPVFEYTEK